MSGQNEKETYGNALSWYSKAMLRIQILGKDFIMKQIFYKSDGIPNVFAHFLRFPHLRLLASKPECFVLLGVYTDYFLI